MVDVDCEPIKHLGAGRAPCHVELQRALPQQDLELLPVLQLVQLSDLDLITGALRSKQLRKGDILTSSLTIRQAPKHLPNTQIPRGSRVHSVALHAGMSVHDAATKQPSTRAMSEALLNMCIRSSMQAKPRSQASRNGML